MSKNVVSNKQNDIVYALLDKEYRKIIDTVCKVLNRDLSDKFSYITHKLEKRSTTTFDGASTTENEYTWKSVSASIKFHNRYLCNFMFSVSFDSNLKFTPIVMSTSYEVIRNMSLFGFIEYVCRLKKK